MKQKKFLQTSLKSIFKKELRINVTEKSKICDFDQWDSLGNFNVLLACEKKFKIKFSNAEFNNINSFKEILKIVKKKNKVR